MLNAEENKKKHSPKKKRQMPENRNVFFDLKIVYIV